MTNTPPSSPNLVDALIVGAGPAGSVAASLLAARGFRVLLVERKPWPRNKPCGGCLNAAALHLLQNHNLRAALSNGLPLHHMSIHMNRRNLLILTPQGLAVDRATFDDKLVQLAIAKGATFSPNTSAKLLPPDPALPHRTLQLQSPSETTTIHARAVLACDGLRGTLLSHEPNTHFIPHPIPRIGFATEIPHCGAGHRPAQKKHTPLAEDNSQNINESSYQHPNIQPHTIAMFIHRSNYVGIVQLPNHSLHIAASLNAKTSNQFHGPRNLINHILSQSTGNNIQLPNTPIEGTPPLSGRHNSVAGYRLLAIGDACGYIEPFTGEGIAWAIRGAIEAANLLPNNLATWPAHLESQWNATHQTQIVRRQWWCKRLRDLLQKPALASLALQTARALPWAPALIASRIAQPA